MSQFIATTTAEINFRPVFACNTGTNMFYRSANMDCAHADLITELIEKYRIKTIIDLRGFTEYGDMPKHDTIARNYIPCRLRGKVLYPLNSTATTDSHHPLQCSQRKRVIIDMLTIPFKLKIFSMMSFTAKIGTLCHLVRFLFTGKRTYENYACSNYLSQHGFIRTYMDMMENSRLQLASVFRVLARADSSASVVISCVLGKDRTGMVCALLQRMAGCDEAEILNSYTQTQNCGERFHKHAEDYFVNRSLPANFAAAPPELLKEFLQNFDQRYPSVEDFLLTSGLSEEEVFNLKLLLPRTHSDDFELD